MDCLPYELKAEIVAHLDYDVEQLHGDEKDEAWDAME